MHCVPAPSSPPNPGNSRPGHTVPGTGFEGHLGEIPAWESCGRIVEKERGDFYEFIACNFFIAVISVIVVFVRSKRLKAMQARQLAARIGLVRATPGGWTQS